MKLKPSIVSTIGREAIHRATASRPKFNVGRWTIPGLNRKPLARSKPLPL